MSKNMTGAIIAVCFGIAMTRCTERNESADALASRRIMLPTGWSITPVGKSLPLGDLPLNIAVSPDGKLAAVTNNGQSTQSIQLINLNSESVIDSMVVGKAWLGLVFGQNSNVLYASGGNDNWVYRFDISENKLTARDTIVIGKPWPERISIAGIAIDEQLHRLYAVTKENNSIYAIDTESKTILAQIPLGGEGYTCQLSPDRKTLYASCWGCDKVVLLDTDSLKITGAVPVGDNPNDLALTRDGAFVFVANANDNSVSVIETRQRRVVETLNTALYPNAPSGSTANSVALSDDGTTLYVANADNNCLAVFDVSSPGQSQSRGFIPAGWYPTSVRTTNKQILIANGKGFSSYPNPKGPNPANPHQEDVQYIGGGLLMGTLSIVDVPDEEELAGYSGAVYKNTPYTKEGETQAEGRTENPIPTRVGDPSPIKYVFYVVKENRTYDQVLGDVPEGNGDTTLVLFGKDITPNQHALAKEFVLLDNFYVNGEVSADGHSWSLGAYATDYLEKNWPTNYGGRGGTYDGEGTREIANNKQYIWDLCKAQDVTYRTYGEFIGDARPNIPVLEGHFCPYFTSWDQTVRDTTRFYQWKRDFDSLLQANAIPSLNTLRFINDHTEGLNYGRPTPQAHAADNDYAVGLFVEYLSTSPIWNESAIFIVEDDAQNGPDHVDAHRTTAYLAGGLVQRRLVDHTVYSTSSMLRTMELILGLPPMSQYDAAAEPMWRCFASTPDATPFVSIEPYIDISARNIAMNEWQRKSETFNFMQEDRVPDDEFNKVLWAAIKGDGYACPPPVHSAFFLAVETGDDD